MAFLCTLSPTVNTVPHNSIFDYKKKETPEPAAARRKSLDNRCSYTSSPDKTDRGRNQTDAVEACNHVCNHAAVTAHFQASDNVLAQEQGK